MYFFPFEILHPSYVAHVYFTSWNEGLIPCHIFVYLKVYKWFFSADYKPILSFSSFVSTFFHFVFRKLIFQKCMLGSRDLLLSIPITSQGGVVNRTRAWILSFIVRGILRVNRKIKIAVTPQIYQPQIKILIWWLMVNTNADSRVITEKLWYSSM